MIIAKKYEVPDDCPPNCKFIEDMKSFGQASICVRCPIFNCKKFSLLPKIGEYSGYEDLCLIKPVDFRADWAEVWERWFKGDMKTFPELYF